LPHVPESTEDIRDLKETFEPYMQLGNQHFYIFSEYRKYLEERKRYNAEIRAKNNKEINERIQQEINAAYSDESGMVHGPDLTTCYSASNVVTKRMRKLLVDCWDKTQRGDSNFEIRNYFIEQFTVILEELPNLALFDYEDKWEERQKFWLHFPDSWRIIFEDRERVLR
jgi:hypothetical protein